MSEARFPLPELTARVDGWPVSITRQHGPCWRVRVSTSRVDGPCWRPVKVQVQGHMVNNTTQYHFISNYNRVWFTFARWRYHYYNVTTALHCHSLLARWRHWQEQYGVGSHSEYFLVIIIIVIVIMQACAADKRNDKMDRLRLRSSLRGHVPASLSYDGDCSDL